MASEATPVVNSAPAASTPAVSDLISQLRSTFFAAEFQKVEKILIDREQKMKASHTQLLTKLESWKKRYVQMEKEHGSLYLKNLIAEEELNKYKAEYRAKTEALAERDREVTELNEKVNQYKAKCEEMGATVEALRKRDREVRELNEKVKILSSEKAMAEAEAEAEAEGIKKNGQLVARISRLEEALAQNHLLKRGVEEIRGIFGKKIKVEDGNPRSVELEPKCEALNHKPDERMLMSPGVGSTTCDSPRKECAGTQEGDACSFDLTSGSGKANRKQLVSGAKSLNKLMDNSLPGGKQSRPPVVIEFDSDDERDVSSLKNDCDSELKSGRIKMTPELVNIEGSGQTGTGNAGSIIENSLMASNSKRKRASSVSRSEHDSSDDDNAPAGRRKAKWLQELGNQPQVSLVNSCLSTPCIIGSNADASPTSYSPGLSGRNATDVFPASGDTCFVTPYTITPCAENFGAKLSHLHLFSSDSSDSEDENDSDQCIDKLIASLRRQKEKSGWAFEADMLQAFRTDNELCLNAVCALHRKSISKDKGQGFQVVDALRGTALAKFLIDGDQQGKLRKSVSELQQHDPKGLEYCRKLAMTYSTQLFDMYRKKEDPFFHPP